MDAQQVGRGAIWKQKASSSRRQAAQESEHQIKLSLGQESKKAGAKVCACPQQGEMASACLMMLSRAADT